MLSKLLVHPQREAQIKAANELLTTLNITKGHPDLLWIEEDKLGIEQTKKILNFFVLKPNQASGKTVVIIGTNNLTQDAQNGLLKILEEPPSNAQLILTGDSEQSLLPTVLSRCEVIKVQEPFQDSGKGESAQGFLEASLEKRFEIIESCEDKEALLSSLISEMSDCLQNQTNLASSAKLLLQAQEWQQANVNIRTILEFLALELEDF